MSLLGKLLKTGIDIVTTPISITADLLTLGGELTDNDESYTSKNFKRIAEDSVEIYEEVEKL